MHLARVAWRIYLTFTYLLTILTLVSGMYICVEGWYMGITFLLLPFPEHKQISISAQK